MAIRLHVGGQALCFIMGLINRDGFGLVLSISFLFMFIFLYIFLLDLCVIFSLQRLILQ